MTKENNFKGAIFDMDGVITQTATIHAKAWKAMLDEFLKSQQGEGFEPFDIEKDYKQYIDGKPRLDGIRSFLESRSISLEEGAPEDHETDTIQGLGKRKNDFFMKLLEEEGVQAFPDALDLIKKWKGAVKLAVISASKNCEYIMKAAGALEYFEVKVDGIVSEEQQLKGKPQPDIFLDASEQLGLDPSQCIVFEDAIAGVVAGKKGGFGLVIGVARNGGERDLINHGADFVVSSLNNVEQKIQEHA